MSTPAVHDITLTNGLFLEASAGTGKTYTLAALVAREIALDDSLRISELLITTFTRNAAAELRDRVRRRLLDTADALAAGQAPADDDLGTWLVAKGREDGRSAQMESNLRRAAVEFDTATVSTIHAVCTKILSVAGLPSGSGSESEARDLTVRQKVNDFVSAESIRGRVHDAVLLEKVVTQVLSAPDAVLWIDPELDDGTRAVLENLVVEITEIVKKVAEATRQQPTYDDLLQRASLVVNDDAYEVALSVIRSRYRIAFVDEAQDTDPLQWDIFRRIIPAMATDRCLVVVGDPKQSIYRFRGADISAYVAERDTDNLVSLGVNFRSDGDLVDALNELLAGQSYGPGIDYVQVGFAPKNTGRKVAGVEPVEIIDIGKASGATAPEIVAAQRVAQLLHVATIGTKPLTPSDICVLVKANELGRALELRLRNLGIPAVSGGTSSVMTSEAAAAIVSLLEAMERPRDLGRVRSVMSSMLFGRSLLDPALMTTEESTAVDGIQDEHDFIVALGKLMRSDGIAAVRSRILAHPACAASILGSDLAERRMTDLNHVVELIHQRCGGGGVDPSDALQIAADLSALDDMAEVTARRIESDSDAVKILTVHAAKGLEFPCVVVADKWNEKMATDNKDGKKLADDKTSRKPVMFLGNPDTNGRRRRNIDVSWVLSGVPRPYARLRAEAEEREELARQFYVAATRAQHHLTVLVPGDDAEKSLAREFMDMTRTGEGTKVPVVPVPVDQPAYTAGAGAVPSTTSPFSADTRQTYRRTSFSGITQEASGDVFAPHAAPGSGNDENNVFFDFGTSYAPADIPTGPVMPLARIPGGTHIGTVVHEIFERFEPSADDLRGQFSQLVTHVAAGPALSAHHTNMVDGLVLAAQTDLGPFMSNRSLATIPSSDRLAELDFEMGLAHLLDDVKVSVIGSVLAGILPADDILRPYADELASGVFDIPLAGLINGSIDAVLRIEDADGMRLYITDYKSNRLDGEDDARLIDAYAPSRLLDAMRHHHYPLQALIYGVAVHRFLRWRAPGLQSDDVIAGIAYFFLRGMVADPAYVDETGCPYGVFQWRAPRGLWSALSDAMSAVRS